MYAIFAAAVFLTCSQQHVVDVLAVTSLCICSDTAPAAACSKSILSFAQTVTVWVYMLTGFYFVFFTTHSSQLQGNLCFSGPFTF